MKEVNLEKLKEQIPEPEFTLLHGKDISFRWSHSPGYAKALWNFTVACLDSEVDNFQAIYDVAASSRDLTHLCGFHKLRFAACKWEEMRWFWRRVWDNSQLIELKPTLRDYIEHVCENSRVRHGNHDSPMGLFDHGKHGGIKPWRTEEWLRARYRQAHPLKPRKPAEPKRPKIAPLTEFWPYIPSAATAEHDLLIAIDKLVPRGMSDSTRADICQDMIVAILTGDATLENLRDATPKYMRQFFRQMPSKYGPLSLETPIGIDGYRTLGEIIT